MTCRWPLVSSGCTVSRPQMFARGAPRLSSRPINHCLRVRSRPRVSALGLMCACVVPTTDVSATFRPDSVDQVFGAVEGILRQETSHQTLETTACFNRTRYYYYYIVVMCALLLDEHTCIYIYIRIIIFYEKTEMRHRGDTGSVYCNKLNGIRLIDDTLLKDTIVHTQS